MFLAWKKRGSKLRMNSKYFFSDISIWASAWSFLLCFQKHKHNHPGKGEKQWVSSAIMAKRLGTSPVYDMNREYITPYKHYSSYLQIIYKHRELPKLRTSSTQPCPSPACPCCQGLKVDRYKTDCDGPVCFCATSPLSSWQPMTVSLSARARILTLHVQCLPEASCDQFQGLNSPKHKRRLLDDPMGEKKNSVLVSPVASLVISSVCTPMKQTPFKVEIAAGQKQAS